MNYNPRQPRTNAPGVPGNGAWTAEPKNDAAGVDLGALARDVAGEDRIWRHYERLQLTDLAHQDIATASINEAQAAGISATVYADYLDAAQLIAQDQRSSLPNFVELHTSGFTAADLLSVASMQLGPVPRRAPRQLLIDNGVGPERIRDLIALGVPENSDAFAAFNDADESTVIDWVRALNTDTELLNWAVGWPTVGALRRAHLTPEVARAYLREGTDAHTAAALHTDTGNEP